MWLVLANSGDDSAKWAYHGLCARGLSPCYYVDETVLSTARIAHRLGRTETHVLIEFADGRRFETGSISGVLNRMAWLNVRCRGELTTDDRAYALQEQTALFTSWLYSLPVPVINRPAPFELAGPGKTELEWRWLAHSAGLGVLPQRCFISSALDRVPSVVPNDDLTAVFVIAQRAVCVSQLPSEIERACVRLSELTACSMLRVDLIREEGAWRFASASGRPSLVEGGDSLLSALAEVLRP
jgi:hypothetical protein